MKTKPNFEVNREFKNSPSPLKVKSGDKPKIIKLDGFNGLKNNNLFKLIVENTKSF